MVNTNIHEAWAQALVANAMDIAKAWDVVYPDGPNSRIKSARSKIAKFNELIAPNPALWTRVAALQAKVDEQIAMTAADVINQWSVIANSDRRKMTSVVSMSVACPTCKGSGKARDTDDDCMDCDGTGVIDGQTVHIASTDTYGPAEILAFEGAEQTKHGIKIHAASKAEARMNLARHFGLFNDKLTLAKSGEPPELPPLPEDPVEAARQYAEWVKT